MEKEREERIAEAEIENLTGARHVESEKLAQILAARQLEIKQIPSDGHCMYRAIEDQLKEQLSQKDWELFTKYQDAERGAGCISDADIFIEGFRMGAMVIMDVLQGEGRVKAGCS